MKTWLVIDSSNLAWRAFYAMGRDLSWQGVQTGVLFGFFRDIISLRTLFGESQFVFCFDMGRSLRALKDPGYKGDRERKYEGMDQGTLRSHSEMRQQLASLRVSYLPDLGFQNVFSQDGYEADDLIAVVAQRGGAGEEFILVSSDKDLYQLLDDRVSVYNPHSKAVINKASFEDEWGLCPSQWVEVKAMAGCPTDCVPGIKGVGEKTAAKYLRGSLGVKTKAYQRIQDNQSLVDWNRELVRLPCPGVRLPQLRDDRTDMQSWMDVMQKLGMKSLVRGWM